jgi:exodeoxyribonuclease-3
MIVATWNINSIRMRLPRLLQWLERRRPDVVCLQETKVVDAEFPLEPLKSLGYHCEYRGEKSYNGVAVLSLQPMEGVIQSLPGDGSDTQCRFIGGTLSGVKIINIYAPNGQEVGSPKYAYKLQWYERLRKLLDRYSAERDEVLVCGDFNVAPEDRDVWDPEQWRGQILFSEPEKEAFRNVLAWGFTDALRMYHQEGGLYTWWDYRAGAFHRGWGLRIDHILLSRSLSRRCAGAEIDREARKGEKPSDHAPMLVTLQQEAGANPDGD